VYKKHGSGGKGVAMRYDGAAVRQWIRMLLPDGGIVAAFTGDQPLAAYADESITAPGEVSRGTIPVTSVAGYLFESDKYLLFSDGMAEIRERYGIPYFRMSLCNAASHVFKEKDCDAIEREVISLIRLHAILGCGASIANETLKLVQPIGQDNTPYSMLCQWLMWDISKWADGNRFDGEVAYHFYRSHTFIPKEKEVGLQAGDLLAWFARREGEYIESLRFGGKNLPRRKDFQALLGNTESELREPEHRYKHLDAEALVTVFRDSGWWW
jgi:hypothetical protein